MPSALLNASWTKSWQAVRRIEELEAALARNAVQASHKADSGRIEVLQKKGALLAQAQQLRTEMRGSQLAAFKEEMRNR